MKTGANYVSEHCGIVDGKVTVQSAVTAVNAAITDSVEEFKPKYDWKELEKVGTPQQWLKAYQDYQEMLQKQDTSNFWHEQFLMSINSASELGKDKDFIAICKEVVDLTYNEATESNAVPSTKTANIIIGQAISNVINKKNG